MASRYSDRTLWVYLVAVLFFAITMIALTWIFGPTIVRTPMPGNQSASGGGAASGAPPAPDVALHSTIVTEGVKAVLQLAVIGVIGGLAKFLFDRLLALRIRREAGLEVQRDFLRRLHTVQAQVSRARETLRADQGAEAYRVQVRELMDARSTLSGLSQELQAADDAMGTRGRVVAGKLGMAEAYLNAVIEEWTHQYPVVTAMHQQSRDPRDIADHLRDHCPKLRELCDTRKEGDYRSQFASKIESAAMQLLRGILEETA